jgi:HEAT repeat protein
MHRPTSLFPLLTLTVILSSTSAWALQTASIKSHQIQSTTVTSRMSTPRSTAKRLDETLLTDGIKWTSWTAASTDTTPTIAIQFRGTRYLTALAITGGCAATVKKFQAFSRPRTITVEGNGRSMTISMADRMKTQRIVIDPPMPTDAIHLRVTASYVGQDKAICVSELQFEEMTLPTRVDEAAIARISALVEQLNEPGAENAIHSLTAMGPTAIPMVLIALRNNQPTQQIQLLETLRRVGSPIAATSLASLAKSYGEGPLTVAIVHALAATGHETAIPILNQTLLSTHDDHAIAAATALRSFGTQARPGLRTALLRKRSERVVVALLEGLQHVGDPHALHTLKHLLGADSPRVRRLATMALNQGSTQELTVLKRQAKDPHPDVRHAVATTLGSIAHNSHTVELLTALLHDPNGWVARTAIKTMVQSNHLEAINALAQYLKQLNAPMGLAVVRGLGKANARYALPPLVQLLQRGEVRYRRAAKRAISAHGLLGLTTMFDAALKDPSLHDDAVEILGHHPQWTIPLLSRVIHNPPQQLPPFVVAALGATGDAAVLPLLNKLWGQRMHRATIVKSLAQINSAEAHEQLVRILADTDEKAIRAAAIRACGTARVRQAIPQLHALLHTEQTPRTAILEALGALKDKTVVPYILTHFTSAQRIERFAMLKTCHAIGTPGCTRLFLDAVTDQDREIQRQATRYLNSSGPDVASYMP